MTTPTSSNLQTGSMVQPETSTQRFGWNQLRQLWLSGGGDPAAADMAAAIAVGTSGGNPAYEHKDSQGNVDARGLWGIPIKYGGSASTFDPGRNAQSAVSMSNNGRDWRQWTAAWNGGYIPTDPGDLNGYLGEEATAVQQLMSNRGLYNVTAAVGLNPKSALQSGGAINGTAGTGELPTGDSDVPAVPSYSAWNPIGWYVTAVAAAQQVWSIIVGGL